MRYAYSLFNRSNKRRADLKALASQFGKVVIPCALLDVRWLSKLTCLEKFFSSRLAIKSLPEEDKNLQHSVERNYILETIDNFSDAMGDVLKLLRISGSLVKRLQNRQLDLWEASLVTMATATELQSMSDLLPEVRELRDSLVSSLKTRFPRQEAAWMSLLKLEQAHLYPDKVIAHKYTLLIDRLKHATNEDLHSKETVAAFVTEYRKMQAKYEQMEVG